MLEYFYNALHAFRRVFSYNSTWLVFCMVIIGFIGTSEMVGVTSFCRFFGLGESGYKTFASCSPILDGIGILDWSLLGIRSREGSLGVNIFGGSRQ